MQTFLSNESVVVITLTEQGVIQGKEYGCQYRGQQATGHQG